MAHHGTRLAILVVMATLAGCAHAGRRAPERILEAAPPADGEGAAAEVVAAPEGAQDAPSPEPVDEGGAAPGQDDALAGGAAASEAPPPAPATGPDGEPAELHAAEPEAEEASAQAREPAPAAKPATSSSGGSGAGRGVLLGAGAVVRTWANVCLSHLVIGVVCIVGLPYYWPYALGAVAVGGAVGAAIGAAVEPDGHPRTAPAGQPGRPSGPQHDEPPPPAEVASTEAGDEAGPP